MNKKELISRIAEQTGETKKLSGEVLDATIQAIVEGLAEQGEVSITGFGKFEVRERAERRGRNPQTKEEMIIPASKAPAFKPAKKFKETIKDS